MKRRTLMTAALAATAALPARAEAPTRFVIGFPAGTTADTCARLFAHAINSASDRNIVVDNRPGAGGVIAAEFVVRSVPDGQTLLVANNGTMAITPHLGAPMPFNPLSDLTPIAMLGTSQQVLIVPPALGVSNVAELLEKARQGDLSYASVGTGSGSHLVMAGLLEKAGVQAQHVPYRGGPPALTDLVSGRVQAMVLSSGSALPLVNDGRLRCIAQTGPGRLLPDVPTLEEQGFPGLELPTWNALYAPANTPAAMIERLIADVRRARGVPAVKTGMTQAAFAMPVLDGDDLRHFVTTENTRWAEIVRRTGVTVLD